MIIRKTYIEKMENCEIRFVVEEGKIVDFEIDYQSPFIPLDQRLNIFRKVIEIYDLINAPKRAEDTVEYWKNKYQKLLDAQKMPDANLKQAPEPHGLMDC